MVGNKRNDEKREVAIRDAEDYAAKHNMLYIETCPETNEGVTAAFHLLVMELQLKDTTRARPREKRVSVCMPLHKFLAICYI